MAKFLVTGGAGFIGSNVVHALVAKKHHVVVLDNLLTGSAKNLSECSKKIQFIKGDIRNLKTVKRAMRGVDYCIHLAALPSVPLSCEHPDKSHDMNINGTFNIFFAAKESRIKRVVYASSSAVYGDTKVLPKHEKIIPSPLSPYALQKLNNEQYAKMFYDLYKVPVIGLRYFNVFGPYQDPASFYAAAIPKFIISLLDGKAPTIYGDGFQSRDFTYVQNVVLANLKACQAPRKALGEVYNIGCGRRVDLNTLGRILKSYIKTDISFRYDAPRVGDVKHSHADIRKAKRLLGYKPSVGLEEGIKKTILWYRESEYCHS